MRRADFFFALSDENEIYGKLPSGAMNCVKRRKKSRLRTFLVDRATANDYLSDAGLIDQHRVPWRGRPLRRRDLLHVVHEVNADRLRRARIERSEDAGLAVSRNFRDRLKTRLAQELHRQLAAFVDLAIL